MFCANCGKELSENAKFCNSCGKEVRKNNNEINVTFHRKKSFVGCAVPMDVYIDGKLIGALYSNGTVQTKISSGMHKIVISMWSATLEKQYEFSDNFKNVYMDIKIKMGLITNKIDIYDIRNEK